MIITFLMLSYNNVFDAEGDLLEACSCRRYLFEGDLSVVLMSRKKMLRELYSVRYKLESNTMLNIFAKLFLKYLTRLK